MHTEILFLLVLVLLVNAGVITIIILGVEKQKFDTPDFQNTSYPTAHPTTLPTLLPTTLPTVAPTRHPTLAPTAAPTQFPTSSPTTVNYTYVPSTSPTSSPTNVTVSGARGDDEFSEGAPVGAILGALAGFGMLAGIALFVKSDRGQATVEKAKLLLTNMSSKNRIPGHETLFYRIENTRTGEVQYVHNVHEIADVIGKQACDRFISSGRSEDPWHVTFENSSTPF